MNGLKETYYTCKRRILSRIVKSQLDLSNISLIAMNCIGGVVYHDCKQKFLSPTVNLYFYPSEFIKFVNNLEYYLSLTPRVEMGKNYPIGFLDDIKIFFMHYNTPEEALSKWEERKTRINKDRVFVIMVERDGFTDEDFENFKRINYPKLLFTKTEKYLFDDSLYISKFKNFDQLPDIIPGRYIYYKMKLVKAIKKVYN